MPCSGTCQVEQHQWREDRIPENPYNGAPYRIPSTDRVKVDEATSEEDLWEDQDLSKFTDYAMFINIGFHGDWVEGVDRVFPREGRQLNCKDEGCICDWNRDKPKVVEDWPKDETRYEVHVRFIWRFPVDGEPGKVWVTRFLLKGAILHKKRIVQGICKENPRRPVVPPLAPPREEGF